MQDDKRDEPAFLTVKDIARRMQVGEQAVRRWIKSGELPAIDIMGQYRIDPKDFQEFLQKHRKTP